MPSGHVAALKKMFASESETVSSQKSKFKVYNLSLGKGASVLDIIKTFESVTGMKIPVEYQGRRQGKIKTQCSFTDLNLKVMILLLIVVHVLF